MKFGVFGNYGHSNIGDEAILRGLLLLLKGREVNVFSDSLESSISIHSEQSKFFLLKPVLRGRIYMLPLVLIYITKNILKNDVVIIGGGGLFNDINKTAFFQYLFILVMSRLLFKKVYLIGISVGPLNSKGMKFILKSASLLANGIYVRDSDSLKFFWKYNSRLIPDLSLGASLPSNLQVVPSENTKRYIVSVSVMDVTKTHSKNFQADYVQKIEDFLVQLKDEQDGLKIEFLAMDFKKDMSVIFPLMRACVNSGIESEVIKLDCFNKVDSAFSRSSFIVATRLHSAILAVLFKKPFLAISYQPKVINYFNSHNLDKNIIDIARLQDIDLLVKYRELFYETDAIHAVNISSKLELTKIIKGLN